jgi:hypothetical protein
VQQEAPVAEMRQESASASMLADIEQEQQTLPSEDEIQAELSSVATELASAALEDEVQIPVVEPELPSWLTQTEEPAEPDVSPTSTSPEPTTPPTIEEIEDEEDIISSFAALMVADVAAAAAAKAEAIAEASSARTREARFLAIQADQVVEEVRTAISNNALTGAEAESYLQEAERNAMRAHAFLADAEAAEEQALNAARNAEAEAEVTEGMAFAASNRGDITGKNASSATLEIEDADVIIGDDDELEESTRKRSTISPQLSQSSQEPE